MPATGRIGAVVALLFPVAFVACTSAAPAAIYSDGVSSRAIIDRGTGSAVEIEALALEGADGAPAGLLERQIIREAQVSLEVEDLGTAEGRVLALVPAPGFVESTNRSEDYVRILLRVPADQLDAFLASLDDVGDVEQLSVSARDVTDQVVDWEARLENLIELRDRLRQLLDRGESVQDLVMVERELARVQSEIDSLTGRLESVRGEVALSRVGVVLIEETRLGPLGYLFYGIGKAVSWLFVID